MIPRFRFAPRGRERLHELDGLLHEAYGAPEGLLGDRGLAMGRRRGGGRRHGRGPRDRAPPPPVSDEELNSRYANTVNPETTPETNETTVAEIAARAQHVAELAAAQEAATSAQHEAEARLLAAVVDAARPALRAVASRIKIRHFDTTNNSGLNRVERHEYAHERGLVVCDTVTRTKDVDGTRGSFRGEILYLLTDGSFGEIKPRGTWSAWQGEPDKWSSELRPLALLDVIQKYDLDAIVSAIDGALAEQAKGGRQKATARALARAERVDAIVRLLGGAK